MVAQRSPHGTSTAAACNRLAGEVAARCRRSSLPAQRPEVGWRSGYTNSSTAALSHRSR